MRRIAGASKTRVGRIAIAVLALAALSRIWIPTGALGREMVRSRLCAVDGPEVDVGDVDFRLPAQVRIRSLSIRSPLRVRVVGARLGVSLLGLLSGGLEPASIRVDSAIVRLPEDWREVAKGVGSWSRIPLLSGPEPLPRLGSASARRAVVRLEDGTALAEAEDASVERRGRGWAARIDAARLPGRLRIDDFRLEPAPAPDSFGIAGRFLGGSMEGGARIEWPKAAASIRLDGLDLSEVPLLGMGFPRQARLDGTASGRLGLRLLERGGAIGFDASLRCGTPLRVSGFPFQKSFLLRTYFPEFETFTATSVPFLQGQIDPKGLEISRVELGASPMAVSGKGRIRPGGQHRFSLECEMEPEFARTRAKIVQVAMVRSSDGKFRLGAVLEGNPKDQGLEVSGATVSHALSSPLSALGALLE